MFLQKLVTLVASFTVPPHNTFLKNKQTKLLILFVYLFICFCPPTPPPLLELEFGALCTLDKHQAKTLSYTPPMFYFVTGSHYVVRADLKLILLCRQA